MSAEEVDFDPLSARTIPGGGEARLLFYEDWLASHAEEPTAPEVFRRIFALEPDAPRLLDVAVRFLAVGSAARTPDLLDMTARLAGMLGRTEMAQDLFQRAYSSGGGSSALISSICLLSEMGELAKVKDLSILPQAMDGRGAVIVPYLAGSAADPAGLPDESRDPAIRLTALYLSCLHWSSTANEALAAQAIALLGKEFPHSPELALSRGVPRVRIASTPELFLAKTAKSASGTSDASTGPKPPTAARKDLAVQTGAFGVRENAEDMVKELVRIGYTPTIREIQRDGRKYYSVLAAFGLSAEEGQAVINALKEKNVEGFLRTDSAP
jgi:hypothetical protein